MKIEFKMNILEKTILAKLDDETENIDFSNRESKNADLSILDYLKEKEMNLLQVQIFCDYIDFFGHLDDKNKLFYTFLMYLENKYRVLSTLHMYWVAAETRLKFRPQNCAIYLEQI